MSKIMNSTKERAGFKMQSNQHRQNEVKFPKRRSLRCTVL